jgi:phosphate:Na+ symporter
MLQDALTPVVRGNMEDLEKVRSRDEDIDVLYAEIIGYLSRLSRGTLADRHVRVLGIYIQAANRLESIGDVVQDNMFEIGRKRLEGGVSMSEGTVAEFEHLHEKVCWAVRTASQAFDAGNVEMAEMVINAKQDVNEIADALEMRLSRRVGATEDGRRVLYQIESELIEYLKRVYYFAKRLAKGTVDLHGETEASPSAQPEPEAEPEPTA